MIPFVVQIVPSAIIWIGVFLVPESPRWLVSRYRREYVKDRMVYITTLPKNHEFVQYELMFLEANRDSKKAEYGEGILGQIKTIFTRKQYIFRLSISASTFIVQNSADFNAVTYYSAAVFRFIGLSGSSSQLLSTGVFDVIKLVASIFWLVFLVDAWGLRSLFLYGCIPPGNTMWYLGAFIYVTNPTKKLTEKSTHLDCSGKAGLAMFYIWTFAYGAFFNGTCWVYCFVLFDQNVRSLTSAVNAASNWFWAFVFARWTRHMFEAMNYGVYFLFTGCLTFAPIYIYCFYPETKFVPLEAVDYSFEGPAWRGRSNTITKMELTKRGKDSEDNMEKIHQPRVMIDMSSFVFCSKYILLFIKYPLPTDCTTLIFCKILKSTIEEFFFLFFKSITHCNY